MNSNERKTRQRREDLLAASADPVLSFDYIKTDLGVSHATFYRHIRPKLEVVEISPRRRGVRSSFYRQLKERLSTAPAS